VTGLGLSGWPAAGPGPGHGIAQLPAQRLARQELSKPIYHHIDVVQRILAFLSRLLGSAARGTPGGWWALAVLGVLAVLLVTGILLWTGPVARSRRAAPAQTLGAGARSARDHFLEASRLAQAGDYGEAILECVRAVAAELEQREVLPSRPGRTADEFAGEAGEALPAEATALRAAAAAFDDVCYGKRPGTPAGYQQVAGLAGRIGIGGRRGAPAASPVPAGSRAS